MVREAAAQAHRFARRHVVAEEGYRLLSLVTIGTDDSTAVGDET